jgi:N-acetylglucosaminyl-diphospho-decaprenol L-rhamnosyltransferase
MTALAGAGLMTGVAAVVVSYNSAEHIAAGLTTLRDAGVRTTVIDNASRDDTAAIVRRDFPEATLIVGDANIGFSAAINVALAGDRSRIVLLVNPDCVAPPETVRGLVRYLEGNPGVGVAGPRLVDAEGRPAVSAHPFESLTSVVLSRFGGSLIPVRIRRAVSGARRRSAYDAVGAGGEPLAVDWLSGACLAVRAHLLREIGGMDERYFLYYEDEELCWRAREQGMAVVYIPNLRATHVGGASSEPGTTWGSLYRSMLIFFDSNRSSQYLAVRLVVVVRALLGLVTASARRVSPRRATRAGGAARSRAWMQVARIAVRGTRHGSIEEAA